MSNKGSKKGQMLQLPIIKRFMTEKEVKTFLINYEGAKLKRILREPTEKDLLVAYEYKKSGLLTSEFARRKGVKINEMNNLIARVSRYKFLNS